ncbi:tetratricopeptide repeat protein [Streptomyces sp. NPDC127051]|uniref:tetratricopeptide repeat protein n=1 Tax=Streptomyces sp. NPDC127051 TaxID=3347119 RepID=UPI003664D063
MIRLLDPGERLDHLLVLDRRLGGSGVVYVMKDLRDDAQEAGRPVTLAAKTLRPEVAGDPARVARFEEECRSWLYLGRHKHVVRLFYVDRFSDQPFAFAEYVPQRGLPQTLRGWLDHHLVEFESAMRFGVQICRALTFAAERGLAGHGDLTPENVMTTPAGVAKVTDWGLSRLNSVPRGSIPAAATAPYGRETDSSGAGPFGQGTRGYAAPEALRAGTGASVGADLFGLGVVVAEMLTGRRLPPGTATADLLPHLDALSPSRAAVLAEVLTSCLSTLPQDRPASAAEVEAVLARAFEDAVGIPVERNPGNDREHTGDRGQRAHSLFMLGHLDEGMRVQTELHREIKELGQRDRPQEQGRDPERAPVVLMDYKERGWVTIVPQEYLDEAEEELRRAPADPQVLKDARGLYKLAGQLERALELCQASLVLHPDDVDALKDTAYVLEKLGRNEESIGQLDRVLTLAPTAQLWLDRAVLCEAAGSTEQERWSVRKGLELEPQNAPLLIRLGNLHMRGGNVAEAAESFRQAAEAAPEDELAFYNLGTALTHLRRFEEAVAALGRALEISPDFVKALNTLGGVYISLGEGQKAAQSFQRAIATDPRYAKAWFNLGQLHEAWGELDKAREAFQRALEIDPGYRLARERMERLNA